MLWQAQLQGSGLSSAMRGCIKLHLFCDNVTEVTFLSSMPFVQKFQTKRGCSSVCARAHVMCLFVSCQAAAITWGALS